MTDSPATAWHDVHWEAEPERPAPEIRMFRHDLMPYAQDNQAVPDYVALVFNDEAGELRLILNTFSLRQLHTTIGRVVTALDERDAPLSDADLAAAFAPIPTYPEAPPAPTPAGAAEWSAPSTWPAAGPSAPPSFAGEWWPGAPSLQARELRPWMLVVGVSGDAMEQIVEAVTESGIEVCVGGPSHPGYWFRQPLPVIWPTATAVALWGPHGGTIQLADADRTQPNPRRWFYINPEDAGLLADADHWRNLTGLHKGERVDSILWEPGSRHIGVYTTHPHITALEAPYEVRGITYAGGSAARLARPGTDEEIVIYFASNFPGQLSARALHVVSGTRAAC